MRKITVSLPAHLVDATLSGSGKGLTATVPDALREYNHRQASKELLALRGKVAFEATWQELRGKADDR